MFFKKFRFNNFIKKMLVIFVIITNLSIYVPMYYSFAVDEKYKEEAVEEVNDLEDEDENSEDETESDEEEKEPALMALAADSIISKYVNTDIYGGSSNVSEVAGGIITNYEETGDGWDSVAEVKYPNGVTRKYRRYKQWSGSYAQEKYWEKEETIAESACGPTAISIILSGYGIDASPLDVVNAFFSMEYYYTSTERIKNVLEKKYNITSEWVTATSDNIQKIRDNFKNGRPIIAGVYNHFITYLGEDSSGDLILADPGYVDRTYGKTLEEYVKNQPGYDVLLITSDGNASTNSSVKNNNTNTTNSQNTTNSSNTTKKTNSSNTTNTTKTSKTISKEPEKCDPYNGGYEAIFTSSTTGRQFKEYRQNLDGWNERYNISGVGCSWTSECGLVSCMIVGSGYSEEANFENATNILVNELNGGTTHSVFFNRWIPGQATDYCGYYSENEMIENLKKGCVGILRLGTTSSWGQHYVTVLDYDSSNGKVYISNPWMDGFPVGWSDPSELTGQMGVLSVDDMIFFSNDGSIVNYSGSGGSRSSKKSNVDMSKNIIPRDENDRSKGYTINIDLDKEIDEMVQKLQKLDFDMSKYLKGNNKQQKLRNIVKACIVTQYPDLRSAKEIANPKSEIPSDETQGCIKIKRYADNETISFSSGNLTNPMDDENNGGGMYLEYMPLQDLKQMINDGNTKALNYFSMDSSNNIVVAGWETMNVSVNIQQTNPEVGTCPTDVYGEVEYTPKAENYQKLTSKSINYLDQVSNYTLPFSLFWSLLVYGNDEKFINDFAELVISTKIILGCNDAVTTTTTKYTQNITKEGDANIDNYYEVAGSERGRDSGKIGEVTVQPVKYNFLITEIDTLKTDKPVLKVKHADIWTAVYNKDYKINIKESEEKGDKVEFEDEILNTEFYQKIVRDDGTFGYTKHGDDDGKPKDPNLESRVDESIDKTFEENRKQLEEDAEKKNSGFEYRYNNLIKFIENNEIYYYDDVKDFLKIREVQTQIINIVIGLKRKDYIEKVFDTRTNSANESQEHKLMKLYANKISDNPDALLDRTCLFIRGLVESFVISKGESNSELYKSLTKDGKETKLCYSVASMQSSQITVVIKNADKTEEYEKNIVEEEIIETPADIRWKDDKNAKENSFVKLLAKSVSARGNFQVINAWFFESVENTAAIADMEDLLKYLFQKVYNTDLGVTPEEADKLLEMFDPTKMKSFKKKTTSGGTIVGGASYSSIKISDEDMQVFYKLIEAEGGGGTHEQMMYLACVVLNRILSSAFDVNTVSEVANAPGQFEVMWNGMYDSAIPSPETIAAVDDAIKTGDITGGGIGFANDWLYDEGGMTAEPSIELFRETWPFGGVVVIFTTASIQAELAQYK